MMGKKQLKKSTGSGTSMDCTAKHLVAKSLAQAIENAHMIKTADEVRDVLAFLVADLDRKKISISPFISFLNEARALLLATKKQREGISELASESQRLGLYDNVIDEDYSYPHLSNKKIIDRIKQAFQDSHNLDENWEKHLPKWAHRDGQYIDDNTYICTLPDGRSVWEVEDTPTPTLQIYDADGNTDRAWH